MYTPLRKSRKAPLAHADHWTLAYFKQNPLKTSSVLLTMIGFGTIYAYHFHVEYAPIFDLQSLASVIFMAAGIGLTLFALMNFLIYIPAFYIGTLCLPDKPARSLETNRKILGYFFFSLIAFILAFSVMAQLTIHPPAPLPSLLLDIGCLLIYPIWHFPEPVFKVAKRPMRETSAPHSDRWARVKQWYEPHRSGLSRAALLAGLFLLQIFPLQIYVMSMRDSADWISGTIDWPRIYINIVWGWIAVYTIAIYLLLSWHLRWLSTTHRFCSALMFFATPLIITLPANNVQLVPATVIHLIKAGNFYASEITLTSEGCKSLYGAKSNECRDDTSIKVYGVYVMSKIGTEAFLKIRPGVDADGCQPQYWEDVLISSKEILFYKIDRSVRFYSKLAIEKAYPPAPSIKQPAPAAEKPPGP